MTETRRTWVNDHGTWRVVVRKHPSFESLHVLYRWDVDTEAWARVGTFNSLEAAALRSELEE